MIKVLFVCTGNICRSPTAEGVFRHLVRMAGCEDRYLAASAGTDAYHAGERPDARAVRVARRHGVSLDGQASRALEDEDFLVFDHIYAMDGGHHREISRRTPPGARARVRMFLRNGDVPDPWYGDERDFEHVFALIRSGAEDIFRELEEMVPA